MLGEYKNYIYGMHLNLSLSGEYVREAIRTHRIVHIEIRITARKKL